MKEGELELSPSQLLFFRTDTLASKFLTEYLFILVLVELVGLRVDFQNGALSRHSERTYIDAIVLSQRDRRAVDFYNRCLAISGSNAHIQVSS